MFEILESEQNKPFKIRGIAMKKNVLSANNKFYSGQLVESVVNKISNIIKKNGSYPITMMADHPTIGTNKTLSTIGKLTNIYLDGDNAIIEAEIANTSLGRDAQELIKGKFVEGLSIRASNGKFRKRYIDGKMVNDVLEMELKGVDLVTNPGVDGARITDIIESDQSDLNNIYISITEEVELKDDSFHIEEEEKSVKLSEATLQDLKNHRHDLYESVKNELKSVFESEFKVGELTESVNTLTTSNKELQESFDALKSEKEVLESELEATKSSLEEVQTELAQIKESEAKAQLEKHIAEKVATLKFAESINQKIKEKLEVLESIEQVDQVFESEVEFLNMVIKESTGVDIKGLGHTDNQDNQVNEEEDFINQVMES